MIRLILLSSLLLVILSCSRSPESAELSDDYVLIEFAARLEEDYDRIYPKPLENNSEQHKN